MNKKDKIELKNLERCLHKIIYYKKEYKNLEKKLIYIIKDR